MQNAQNAIRRIQRKQGTQDVETQKEETTTEELVKAKGEYQPASRVEEKKIDIAITRLAKDYEGIMNEDEQLSIFEKALEAFERTGEVNVETVAIEQLGIKRFTEYGRNQKEMVEQNARRKSLGGSQKNKDGSENKSETIMSYTAAQIAKNPDLLKY